jgi:hypothetical protein
VPKQKQHEKFSAHDKHIRDMKTVMKRTARRSIALPDEDWEA